MSEFTLYSYFRSSASYRVRCAMAVKGLSYEYSAIHLLKDGGEQHSATYRELNPSREVPTLVHRPLHQEPRVIGQSVAILEYLDAVAPSSSPRLFPLDATEAAWTRQFCEIINCLQPLQNLRLLQFLTNDLKLSETQKQLWIDEWLGRGFEALESLLVSRISHSKSKQAAGPYCQGAELTAADCFLVPQVFAAKRLGVNLDRFTEVLRICSELEKQPSFVAAHPHRQPDTPEDLRLKN